MKKHYLANGQECFLKEKLSDNKFIVNRIFFEDDIEFSDDLDIVVDAVYVNAPTEVYDAKIVEIQNHIDKLQYDLIELLAKKTALQYEIGKIQLTNLAEKSFIVNRTEILNSKRLILFLKDKPMPIILDDTKTFKTLRIVLDLEVSTGYETKYHIYLHDANNDYDVLCEKYGLQVDKTDDEIDALIRKRLIQLTFSIHLIIEVDDKYLAPFLLDKKYKHLEYK